MIEVDLIILNMEESKGAAEASTTLKTGKSIAIRD
jgi:hypothetical protein